MSPGYQDISTLWRRKDTRNHPRTEPTKAPQGDSNLAWRLKHAGRTTTHKKGTDFSRDWTVQYLLRKALISRMKSNFVDSHTPTHSITPPSYKVIFSPNFGDSLSPHYLTVVTVRHQGHQRLLLLSGDIELNPGPSLEQIQKEGKKCTDFQCILCSNKFRNGPSLAAAHSCAAEDCSALCHAKCDGLSKSSSFKARSDPDYMVTWMCPAHGSGIATVTKITKEPTQATTRVDPVLIRDRHCDACGKLIDKNHIQTAFQCHEEDCLKVCHLGPACSKKRRAQGSQKARRYLEVWWCREHNPAPPGEVQQQDLAVPAPPPSLESLVQSGLSMAEARSIKEKCTSCG